MTAKAVEPETLVTSEAVITNTDTEEEGVLRTILLILLLPQLTKNAGGIMDLISFQL